MADDAAAGAELDGIGGDLLDVGGEIDDGETQAVEVDGVAVGVVEELVDVAEVRLNVAEAALLVGVAIGQAGVTTTSGVRHLPHVADVGAVGLGHHGGNLAREGTVESGLTAVGGPQNLGADFDEIDSVPDAIGVEVGHGRDGPGTVGVQLLLLLHVGRADGPDDHRPGPVGTPLGLARLGHGTMATGPDRVRLGSGDPGGRVPDGIGGIRGERLLAVGVSRGVEGEGHEGGRESGKDQTM